MKVAVGSTNPVKIEAARKAFAKVWPKEKIKVVGVEVSSGVSNQPMSQKETIKGAKNRAITAQKTVSSCDFAVGFEGGLERADGKWFDTAWIVVRNKDGKEGIASTIRMHTPEKLVQMSINKGMEIGHIDDILFKQKNSKHGIGHFGLMTNGILDRESQYANAVIAALSRFLQRHLH